MKLVWAKQLAQLSRLLVYAKFQVFVKYGCYINPDKIVKMLRATESTNLGPSQIVLIW